MHFKLRAMSLTAMMAASFSALASSAPVRPTARSAILWSTASPLLRSMGLPSAWTCGGPRQVSGTGLLGRGVTVLCGTGLLGRGVTVLCGSLTGT